MNAMDIHTILKHLPHRYPMLLVDRVIDVVAGEQIHAVKNVSINEPFFAGHFPHHPVMPGVLILEALAQAAVILSFKTLGSKPDGNTVYYFVGIDGARFKRPVMPGDQLHLHVSLDGPVRRGLWKFKGQAKVDGVLATEATLICTARKIEPDEQLASAASDKAAAAGASSGA
jgi:3-hydroxyacyl-[acyl-carrier-protein] dehydratase